MQECEQLPEYWEDVPSASAGGGERRRDGGVLHCGESHPLRTGLAAHLSICHGQKWGSAHSQVRASLGKRVVAQCAPFWPTTFHPPQGLSPNLWKVSQLTIPDTNPPRPSPQRFLNLLSLWLQNKNV